MAEFRVLITVKTYPVPSAGYDELVCTAGICPEIGFVRLYPVPFRYLPMTKQYRKYQWIEVEAKRNRKDPRPESYRPNCETIQLVGEPLGTDFGWAERKQIVLPLQSSSMEELRARQKAEGISLGLIRPAEVEDFTAIPEKADWSPRVRAKLAQLRLFGPERKPLSKLPYKFQYRFRCDDPRCNGHRMMIEDWELGVLYLKMVEETQGDEQAAIAKVREKFFGQLCGDKVETYFFMGNMWQRPNSWLVLGGFYPPVSPQSQLQLNSNG